MTDVWSKANKTSHLSNGAVMSYYLLYEMTLLDPSTFAIGATLSMSLVKHYSVTYSLRILMGMVVMTGPPNFECRSWENLIWINKDIVSDIIPFIE